MPITKELKNLKKFESAGFTHDQAETLADVIEESHVDSHESLKEFIRNEFNNQRAEIANSQKDLLIKLFGIIVGTVGIAVTILKLF